MRPGTVARLIRQTAQDPSRMETTTRRGRRQVVSTLLRITATHCRETPALQLNPHCRPVYNGRLPLRKEYFGLQMTPTLRYHANPVCPYTCGAFFLPPSLLVPVFLCACACVPVCLCHAVWCVLSSALCAARALPVSFSHAVLPWTLEDVGGDYARVAVTLPTANMKVTRTFSMDGSVVTMDTNVLPLDGQERDIEWCEHVTIGDPFLDGATVETGVDGAWMFPDPLEDSRFPSVGPLDAVDATAALAMPLATDPPCGDVITTRLTDGNFKVSSAPRLGYMSATYQHAHTCCWWRPGALQHGLHHANVLILGRWVQGRLSE